MDGLYAFKRNRFRNTSQQNKMWNNIVNIILKHPALPVEEVALKRNYPR
jgi:hypothetical protein